MLRITISSESTECLRVASAYSIYATSRSPCTLNDSTVCALAQLCTMPHHHNETVPTLRGTNMTTLQFMVVRRCQFWLRCGRWVLSTVCTNKGCCNCSLCGMQTLGLHVPTREPNTNPGLARNDPGVTSAIRHWCYGQWLEGSAGQMWRLCY